MQQIKLGVNLRCQQRDGSSGFISPKEIEKAPPPVKGFCIFNHPHCAAGHLWHLSLRKSFKEFRVHRDNSRSPGTCRGSAWLCCPPEQVRNPPMGHAGSALSHVSPSRAVSSGRPRSPGWIFSGCITLAEQRIVSKKAGGKLQAAVSSSPMKSLPKKPIA